MTYLHYSRERDEHHIRNLANLRGFEQIVAERLDNRVNDESLSL
jgi:hypothetical protein